MEILSAADVHASLRWPDLIDTLRHTYANPYTMPQRQVMRLNDDPTNHDAFALLPSWNDEMIALKAFTYFPNNSAPHPSLHSQILLFHRNHGQPLALIDGSSVTYWRTAGISALASHFLSRKNSQTLLLLGSGNLAPHLIRAHASIRPLSRILLWGRSPEKVQTLLDTLAEEFPQIHFTRVSDLPSACAEADIIVCATGSQEILLRGAWIRPGTHVDLLGNHHANHRECDTELVVRSKVYVDTYLNCLKEAGEILLPIAEGVFRQEQILGELANLCTGKAPARQSEEDITLFKSVGAALGDLATAQAVWKSRGA
jgi:1-pyrroline-2-carboxylate reductase [NAD(P)H]